MHHWICMHHWIDLCITEYICIIELTYASLNILMHHWIYLCIIEWIYASAGRQLDLCIMERINASTLTYLSALYHQYCFVIAPGHRWLMDVSSHGVTIADYFWRCCDWVVDDFWITDDLWMRRQIGFQMTNECVGMCVADLKIRHGLFIVIYSSQDLFTLCCGWLLSLLWSIVGDFWMHRHIGFQMTYESVVMYVADLSIRHVLFIVNHSSLDLLSLCLVVDLWTYHAIMPSDYEYIMGCFGVIYLSSELFT